MTTARSLDWLSLASPDPPTLAAYYGETLGLSRTDTDGVAGPPAAAAFDVPPGRLLIRPLSVVPSGGMHTHFAIGVTPGRYDWVTARLARTGPITERRFGDHRSVYRIDPHGHCVEFGERDGLETDVGPLFEVVLEVADIDTAVNRYTDLGFDVVDRGADRPRCRLRGPFDLEVWEPHLGIADARGGCHVDLGLTVDDPPTAAAILGGGPAAARRIDDRMFVRDGDGHTWWLAEE